MKKTTLLLAFLSMTALTLRADDPPPSADSTDSAAAHDGFPASRYEQLWSKSPFAVETPDQAVTESADYSLVGVAQLGNVTYASLIDKHSGSHILVSSDKALGGLSLASISKHSDGVYASLTNQGQPLVLKLESSPSPTGAPGTMPAGTVPSMQSIPMPGAETPQFATPPRVRFHRPLIHLPPRFPNQSVPGATGQPTPPGA